MDPVTIGASVVALLTPYAKDAGQELVKTIGETGVDKLKDLMHWLKGRFAGDPIATSDLTRFEQQPETFAPALQETINTKVKADPAFAGEVQQRVKDIAPIINVVISGGELTDVIGLDAGTVNRGTINVTETATKIKGGTAAKFGTIG